MAAKIETICNEWRTADLNFIHYGNIQMYMLIKRVKALQYADLVDMGGIPVRQPLPAQYVESLDPFLLLHHFTGSIPVGSKPQETGVGPHPHRGFSPVTFVLKGDVHHRDSRGNSSIVKEGGIQWMHAGMGIIHSERPSREFAETGGEQEIIQLWINTAQRYKMDQPTYQAIQSADIPTLRIGDGDSTLQVIAGNYGTLTGPANTKSELLILRGDLKAGDTHTFLIPETYNTGLYVATGSIEIENYGPVDAHHLVVFQNDGEAISVSAHEATSCIVIAGVPLNEKVEIYGPFVMTNQTEIMRAIRDYQMGKMGILIEEFD
jgi:redox-sensitive bicupin YhaK (pirin superfamily)